MKCGGWFHVTCKEETIPGLCKHASSQIGSD
jgi:hypothetical protein